MSVTAVSDEQFLERAEAEQLVDQHLLERELLAAVERELELGEHFADDRAEFLGELVLRERRSGFGIDTFEQARKHLLLDAVDRGLKAFGARIAGFARCILAIGEPCHCFAAGGGATRVRIGFGQRCTRKRHAVQRRKLLSAHRLGGALSAAALHRSGNAERGPATGAAP